MTGSAAAFQAPRDPEREALEALGRDDRDAALNILMAAYGQAIYRFCRRMVAREELAEDAHQMTFVQAYEALAAFSRRSSLRTWLFSIARHRCLDALKIARRRRRRFVPVAEPPETRDPVVAADDRLAATARAQALARCLRELAPKVRMPILLRFQQDLSYPQMARVCGERAPTLQARVARAMPSLRRCLDALGQAA